MDKYKQLIRGSFGDFLNTTQYSGCGVYVVSCYPQLGCLYVGISDNVYVRMRQHLAADDMIGKLLRGLMADAYSFGFDVLVPPDNQQREWMQSAERELVGILRPACNTQHRL